MQRAILVQSRLDLMLLSSENGVHEFNAAQALPVHREDINEVSAARRYCLSGTRVNISGPGLCMKALFDDQLRVQALVARLSLVDLVCLLIVQIRDEFDFRPIEFDGDIAKLDAVKPRSDFYAVGQFTRESVSD